MFPMALFPSTHWSFVSELRETAEGEKSALVQAFLLRYTTPMRAFLDQRFRALTEHDRDELMQDFVLDQVLQRRVIEFAQQERGKLRSFLCTSLRNYAVSWALRRDRRDARKTVPLDTVAEPVSDDDVHRGFDLAWARFVLDETFARMKHECEQSNRHLMWDVFELRLLRPMTTADEAVPYSELAERFGVPTKQLENLLTSAKRMLRRRFRDVVGDYVEGSEAVEAEIRDLYRIVADSGNDMESSPP